MSEPSPTAVAPFPAPSAAWPWILVGLGVLGVGVAAWSPVPAGVWHDDGVYMLVAKAIAGGHGLVYDGVAGSPPAAKFPPLYPAFLGGLWWMLGRWGIGAVTLAATVANLCFLAVGAALFGYALRTGARLSIRASAVVAGLGFVSTDLLRTALVPLSESLFVMVAMAAFALWANAERDDDRGARALLAAVLAVAVAIRSAGLALVVAFALALLLRRGWRTAAWVALPAATVMVAWGAWSSIASDGLPPGTQDLLGPYGSWFAAQTLAAPSTFLAGLPGHTVGVLDRIAAIALPGLYGVWRVMAAVPLGALAVTGAIVAVRRFPPMGWFVPAYLGMLLLWPYLDRRLVAPLHPIVLACGALGAATVVEHLRWRHTRTALTALAVVWGAAYSVVTAGRIADDWPVAAYRLRAERLAGAVEAISRTMPADAVIGAPEFWAALHLHGGWTVSPSVRFDPRSVDPEAPLWGTPDEQIALWREMGIDHLLLEQAGTLHGAALDQLEGACPGTVFVLAQTPPQIVVKIVWDAPCSAADPG